MDKSELDNKLLQFIDNKISESSKDQFILNSIKKFDSIATFLGIEYSVIGSCGIRSYLPYFTHLPNDFDVVVNDSHKSKLKEHCLLKKIDYVEQLGRDKIQLGGFWIHLIPNRMNIIDKSKNEIFTQVNLDIKKDNTEFREIILASCAEKIKVRVHNIETQIFLALLTPINTTTFHDLICITERNSLNSDYFNILINSNNKLKLLIFKRLRELIDISNIFRDSLNPLVIRDLELIFNTLFDNDK